MDEHAATVIVDTDGNYYLSVPELVVYIRAHANAHQQQPATQAALHWLADAIADGVAAMATIPDNIEWLDTHRPTPPLPPAPWHVRAWRRLTQ